MTFYRHSSGQITEYKIDPSDVPVVVIDPEDAEQVERLIRLIDDACVAHFRDDPADQAERDESRPAMQAALREFARPTPRIEEPQGLGAVVEDADGKSWVKVDTAMACDSWTRADAGMQGNDTWVKFHQTGAVRVLPHGVTEGES